MAEAIETLAARLGQLQGELQRASATAQSQQSRINQLESELQASRLETSRRDERMIEALEKLGEKSSSSAVDSKGVGKPFTFSSDEAKFHASQKKVRNYVSAALPGAREFLEWAGDRGSEPITRAGLEEQFPDKIQLLAQVEENLYTCLSSQPPDDGATSFPPWSALNVSSWMIWARPLKHGRRRSGPTRVGEVLEVSARHYQMT